MSDHENDNSSPDVRRVSSRDRKQQISSGGLFDSLPPVPPPGTPPPPPPPDLPEASADDPGDDDDDHARFKPPKPAETEAEPVEDPPADGDSSDDDEADDEDDALNIQAMLDAVAAEAAETGEHLKVFESIRSYQPEPEEVIPEEADVSADDDADSLIDELDSQAITPVNEDDDALDALIDQVEEDTSKLRAITDAQIAAAEAAERARMKPPVDRFPPLPEEEIAAASTRAQLRPPPMTRSQRRAAETREERIREHAEAALPPIPERGGCLRPQNILTIGLLGISVLIIGYFAFIWQNPYSPINPLAPLTPPPIVITATFTPSLTFTPAPTETPTPTLTPSPVPTDTPVPTPTSEGGGVLAPERIRFVVQNNRTLYLTNPDSRGACNWSSIGGTVVDLEGDAVRGYRVQLIGDDVDEMLETGSAPGFGPGGFEYQVGREALELSFTAQLFDPSGTPVSDLYRFETSTICEWNIAVLRFVEIPQADS